MSRTTPFNDEERRILAAAARGALTQNEHGRWVITDETQRPARKDRERLIRVVGAFTYPFDGRPARLTIHGVEACRDLGIEVTVR